MTPNPQEHPAPQEPDPLSAEEEEAFLAEIERYGSVAVGGQGLEACLTCSLVFVLLLAVAAYFLR